MHRCLTGCYHDEPWCYQYDLETKCQSIQQKTRNSLHLNNAHVLVFYLSQRDSSLQGHRTWYNGQLKLLLENYKNLFERKKLKSSFNKWILHRDNTPAYEVLSVHEFLGQQSIPKLDLPTYYPDVAQCNFCLLLNIKNAFQRKQI